MGCFRDRIQACLFVEMAVVHSGVHQTGSLGRETSFFDGIKRSMPSWIRDVSCWQDLSGSSDMVQGQSVFCRKERKRHQSALLYLQTVRESWDSMRGWTNLKSANTTQWSDFPTSAKVCVVTRSGKLDMTRSSVLAPRVGWSTCWVKLWAAQISSRYSPAGDVLLLLSQSTL